MLRKNYFSFLLVAALFLCGGLLVFAQTAPVRGKVELKKADGTTEPVAGAMVEVFRTDSKGKGSTAKTGKKGEFAFAGLMLGQTFALSISAPNVKPAVYPNIKAGMENVSITVVEGDGKRSTEEEVRRPPPQLQEIRRLPLPPLLEAKRKRPKTLPKKRKCARKKLKKLPKLLPKTKK